MCSCSAFVLGNERWRRGARGAAGGRLRAKEYYWTSPTYMHMEVQLYASISTRVLTYIFLCLHMYTRTLRICIHTYIHTYIQAYKHTNIQTNKQTYIHTYIHTYIYAYIHTYIHTYMHACMHTYIHTCIHACIHAYMHTCIHAFMHTYTGLNSEKLSC